MNTWIKQFRTEDWVVTAVSAVLLLLAALIPGWLPKIPKSLVTPGDWQNTVLLYALVLATLAAGWLLCGPCLWLLSRIPGPAQEPPAFPPA